MCCAGVAESCRLHKHACSGRCCCCSFGTKEPMQRATFCKEDTCTKNDVRNGGRVFFAYHRHPVPLLNWICCQAGSLEPRCGRISLCSRLCFQELVLFVILRRHKRCNTARPVHTTVTATGFSWDLSFSLLQCDARSARAFNNFVTLPVYSTYYSLSRAHTTTWSVHHFVPSPLLTRPQASFAAQLSKHTYTKTFAFASRAVAQ